MSEQETQENKIKASYQRACELGQFRVEACYHEYFDYDRRGRRFLKSEKSDWSDIVFTAYDGYHVALVCLNKHAKQICDTINAMHDEEKIREYLEYYREHKAIKKI
jgi:hypothetical protein